MIKVTIELLKHGNPNDRSILAEADIWNDLSGSGTRGNYRYRLWKKRKSPWREGRIENFPRNSYGAWTLLYRILRDIFD